MPGDAITILALLALVILVSAVLTEALIWVYYRLR